MMNLTNPANMTVNELLEELGRLTERLYTVPVEDLEPVSDRLDAVHDELVRRGVDDGLTPEV